MSLKRKRRQKPFFLPAKSIVFVFWIVPTKVRKIKAATRKRCKLTNCVRMRTPIPPLGGRTEQLFSENTVLSLVFPSQLERLNSQMGNISFSLGLDWTSLGMGHTWDLTYLLPGHNIATRCATQTLFVAIKSIKSRNFKKITFLWRFLWCQELAGCDLCNWNSRKRKCFRRLWFVVPCCCGCSCGASV